MEGGGGCPISISGMEVEVMEGDGTTYDFTPSILFHIALCICVVGCLTWLGTILQMGSEVAECFRAGEKIRSCAQVGRLAT